MNSFLRMMSLLLVAGMAGLLLLGPQRAAAHCDTMDGPVIKDARAALEKGDVAPVLKWVGRDGETEIRTAFEKTLTVRAKGKDARELADQFFFETLVRVHRASEGMPFTGLKPAGTAIEPAVAAADQALSQGTVDKLVEQVTSEVARGIRERYARAIAAQKQKDANLAAGREFVEAYVKFVHYVEGIHALATGAAGTHAHAGEPPLAAAPGAAHQEVHGEAHTPDHQPAHTADHKELNQ